MSNGKIKTLFSDREKTEALFPRTKINAVSDADGVGLDAILDKAVFVKDIDEQEDIVPLNADTLSGRPVTDFATKEDLGSLNAEAVGARPDYWLPTPTEIGAAPAGDYATESFVTNKITEAQLGAGENTEIDLSGYATKDELAAKADTSHTHSYAGSSSAGGAANSVKTNLTVKLNSGSTEGTDMFTYNGSTAKTVNITPSVIGAAPSSHTHQYAGSSSAGGAATSANKVNKSLTVKLNGGSTEGTNLFTFNGSADKSINITPSAIGAAASSHGTHVSYGTSAKALGTSAAGSASTVSRSDHVHALPALTSCTGTLSVAKGGTGATSAANALKNLGLANLKTYDFTVSSATNPQSILNANWDSISTGYISLIRVKNGTIYTPMLGLKTDANNGSFMAATALGGLYVIRRYNGNWSEKVAAGF